MSTYKVKMTNSRDTAQIEELSKSEMELLEKTVQKVSIKVSPRMLKKMKQITGLQRSVSNETILYTFVKYQINNFAQ